MTETQGSLSTGTVDKITGVRRPTYKRPFNSTMLGTNHIYQSISMMMVSVYHMFGGDLAITNIPTNKF